MSAHFRFLRKGLFHGLFHKMTILHLLAFASIIAIAYF